MKNIGSFKEVYLNLAEKTKNGLTRKDIINIKKNTQKLNKKIILSKTNNKFNNPLIRYKKTSNKKKNKFSKNKKENNINSYKTKLKMERQQQRINRRKKSMRKKTDKKQKLSSKISFNLNNNITKEYYCKQIDGYESDNENDDDNYDIMPSKEFKIEEMPDIDISNYI